MRNQIQRDDEDNLGETEGRSKELGAAKAQSDANDRAIATDAANRAAAAKKAHEESEFNRKFNQFDGLVHEDNGSSWNKGDGLQVGGVNNYLKTVHKRNKNHRKNSSGDTENFQEQKAREDELANIEAAKKAAAAKAVWDKRHNQFDGLVHEDDGKTYEQDGKEVKGVNKFV